jgi:lambda family phage portal protein
MVQILDARGEPMKPRRAMALQGGGNTPYDAADYQGEHTRDWRPYLSSTDAALNPVRDTIVARARDVIRNDGWASGALTRIVDSAIGATFRPVSKPDYRAIAAYTGNKAFDAVWADEYRRAADSHWRAWADDPGRYCDAERSKWMALLFGVAFRHLLADNDALAVMQWIPERLGVGRARYATSVQLIDPDRLSNPQSRYDMANMRGGVEVDDYGAAVRYHIRKAHAGDWWAAGDSVTWEPVEREDEYGRPIAVHYFEPDGASQHRGGAGVFTPVLQRLRMLFRYDVAELDSALLNAIMFGVAESPFDHSLMEEAVGDMDGGGTIPDAGRLGGYQEQRADFHEERRIRVGSSRITTLFPGEKLNVVSSERPNPNFAAFEKAVLRNVASAAGMASHQVTNDYSDANYSSMRAALLEAWKTIHRRRHNFGAGFAGPIRSAWLEEAMEVDDFPLPAGAPSFAECRQAYGACRWLGPGRGWVDPVAEKKGALLGIAGGLSTLQTEIEENSDLDLETVLDGLAVEKRMREERGLAPFSSGEGPGSQPAAAGAAETDSNSAKPGGAG